MILFPCIRLQVYGDYLTHRSINGSVDGETGWGIPVRAVFWMLVVNGCKQVHNADLLKSVH